MGHRDDQVECWTTCVANHRCSLSIAVHVYIAVNFAPLFTDTSLFTVTSLSTLHHCSFCIAIRSTLSFTLLRC